MQKIRVGVLRGGPSNEYNISLKTGSSVLKNLPEEKYEARDIFISKNGEWHFRGIPIAPEKIINQSAESEAQYNHTDPIARWRQWP